MANVDENTEILYVIDGSDVDGKAKEGDDLKGEVLETLSTYLHCLSKDGRDGNKFQISPTFQKKSIRDETGDPAPLDDVLNGSSNPYAPTAQNAQLREASDSGKVFRPTIGSFLNKGKSDTFIRDLGNGSTNRAGQATSTKEEGPVFDAIRTALDGNRFSPGANGAFAGDQNITTLDPTPGGIDDRTSQEVTVLGKTQPLFGRHVGFADPLASGDLAGADIRMEDLKKIGTSLMLRAAREIKAVQEGDPFEAPESFAVGLGALLPGASQIALLKVDTNSVKASAVMEENFGLPPKPRTDTEGVINPGNRSWGHLNTPLEPYDGFLPIGMTALALVMTIAIRVLAFSFVGLLALVVKPKGSEVPNRGPFITGEFGKPNPPGALFSLSAIGIRDTERDFLSVVNDGLDLFFAFDGADFRRVVREPQFFAIFVRNIIRSGNIIVNSVREVFSGGQNPLAAAQAFIGLIDVLKSSKIVAFLNIMAQLGDKAAEARDQGFDPQEKKKSSIENLPIIPATNVMRIRNSKSDLRSGMRTSATTSRFLFPPEVLRASDVIASTSEAQKAIAALPPGQLASTTDLDSSGRISADEVQVVEAELDAEYVPFYFHDLRTNEIVSFHAFLDNLEDNYSPQYESSTAYGRVDNVRTYVSTERTITLQFKILATSKEDFDFMWWKINKLTTLVYPSWTRGRQVAAGDSRFIQPFSQVPASTPVIRMRIGDVIRSNFSKLGLARVFGAGLQEEQFNLVETPFSGESLLEKFKGIIIQTRARMSTNPALAGDPNQSGYFAGEEAILLPKRTGYSEAPNVLEGIPGAAGAAALLQQNPKKRLTVTANTKVRILGPTPIPVPLLSAAKIVDYGEHRVAFYTIEVVDAQSDEMQGKFLVTYDDLVPDPDQVLSSAQSILPLPPDLPVPPSILTPPNPFDPEENVIVKSFQTVQGKGLGGVITGMTFTDLASPNVVWETSEFGARAPKMINVNMTFAVIHDIAPGIDENGFNRAFQYPVGNAVRHLVGDNNVVGDNSGEENFNTGHKKAGTALRGSNAKGGLLGGGFPGGL